MEEGDFELTSFNNSIDPPFVGIAYEKNYCPTPSGPRGHVLVKKRMRRMMPSEEKKSLSKCNEVNYVLEKNGEWELK